MSANLENNPKYIIRFVNISYGMKVILGEQLQQVMEQEVLPTVPDPRLLHFQFILGHHIAMDHNHISISQVFLRKVPPQSGKEIMTSFSLFCNLLIFHSVKALPLVKWSAKLKANIST